jgi:ABC-type nitrate/sulfonate/bicarbonate transport system substrate-binding protein
LSLVIDPKIRGVIMKKTLQLISSLLFWITIGFITAISVGANGPVRFGAQCYPDILFLQGFQHLWDRHGIEVDLTIFSSDNEGIDALTSGKCDILYVSTIEAVKLSCTLGDNALIIASVQKDERYATFVRDGSLYTSWADLNGHPVATLFDSGAEYVLRAYFQQKDVVWESFKWINLKPPEMLSALDKGKIEAFTISESLCAMTETIKMGKCIYTYGDIALSPILIFTTRGFADNHRAEIVNFLGAHLDKTELIKENPKIIGQYAAQSAVARTLNISQETLEKIIKDIDYTLDIENDVVNQVQETALSLQKLGMIDKVPVIWYDRSFLEQARQLRFQYRIGIVTY